MHDTHTLEQTHPHTGVNKGEVTRAGKAGIPSAGFRDLVLGVVLGHEQHMDGALHMVAEHPNQIFPVCDR